MCSAFQVDPEECVIDGTIDGLSPGEHGLAIHECGDLSGGCDRFVMIAMTRLGLS